MGHRCVHSGCMGDVWFHASPSAAAGAHCWVHIAQQPLNNAEGNTISADCTRDPAPRQKRQTHTPTHTQAHTLNTHARTHRHTQALTSTHEHTQAHTGTHRHTQAHTGTHRHTQAHTGTHRHTQAHAGTHRHTQAHTGTHRHTNTWHIPGWGDIMLWK